MEDCFGEQSEQSEGYLRHRDDEYFVGRHRRFKYLQSPDTKQWLSAVLHCFRHGLCVFFVQFAVHFSLHARMIHLVMLLRATDASSHMTKCHMCLPFGSLG